VEAVIKDLHQEARSNVPALLVNLAAVGVGVFAIAAEWPTGHPIYLACVMLALAYFQHCWTIIFHEDAHYALYPAKRWHNIFNGTIVGTLLLVPFTIYRQVHIRHHNRMNTPDDWELWPYTDPSRSLTFRRMFVALDVLLGAWVGPYIYDRIFWARNSPMTDPGMRRRVAIEFGLIVLFWGSVLGVVAWYGAWQKFAMIYLIPAWLTGLIQTFRKLTEHLGLPAGGAMNGARTVLSQTAIGRAMAWTSFHIEAHGLHHRYPQMPHGNLKRAMDVTEDVAPELVFPSYWRAVCNMLPHLLRPGIGVNAWVREPQAVESAVR